MLPFAQLWSVREEESGWGCEYFQQLGPQAGTSEASCGLHSVTDMFYKIQWKSVEKNLQVGVNSPCSTFPEVLCSCAKPRSAFSNPLKHWRTSCPCAWWLCLLPCAWPQVALLMSPLSLGAPAFLRLQASGLPFNFSSQIGSGKVQFCGLSSFLITWEGVVFSLAFSFLGGPRSQGDLIKISITSCLFTV